MTRKAKVFCGYCKFISDPFDGDPDCKYPKNIGRKDTWRYARSGATTVVGVSADEIATVEKVRHGDYSLKRILEKCTGSDMVFLEGFKELVAKDTKIAKIIVVNSQEQAEKDVRTFRPVIALTGPLHPKLDKLQIPYIDVCKNAEKLADVVERAR